MTPQTLQKAVDSKGEAGTVLKNEWGYSVCSAPYMAGRGSSNVENLKNFPIIGRSFKDNFLNSVAAQGYEPGLILYEETPWIKKKKRFLPVCLWEDSVDNC